MPKQKTHKGTKKRKRKLRGTTTVAKPMEKALRMALNGYSS